jgi:hypothetical protein
MTSMQNKKNNSKIGAGHRKKIIAVAEMEFAEFGYKDSLLLYRVDQVRITDQRVILESGKEYHPILHYTGKSCDEVSGTVFELSSKDITRADNYEVNDYQKVRATLKSGRICWIYAAADEWDND